MTSRSISTLQRFLRSEGSVLADTIPMSAAFVDRIGATTTRSAIRRLRPGYRLVSGPFVSTSDTLAGDPQYGFPCPWITNHYRRGGKAWAGYHSSADVPRLLSPAGLATVTLSSASYLVYLANAGNRELLEIAESETHRVIQQIRRLRKADRAEYERLQHHVTIDRLKRWMRDGSRAEVLSLLNGMESAVGRSGPRPGPASRRYASYSRLPRRTRPITPTLENSREPMATQIRETGLPGWTLFWADGSRSIAAIAKLVSQELEREVSPETVSRFFEAHESLGYVDLPPVARSPRRPNRRPG